MRIRRDDRKDFDALASPLLADERYQRLKKYIQHGRITTYDHCCSVAWNAFRLNRLLGLRADERRLVRASLLHDYYLYDWHESGDPFHGLHHPGIAAEKAERDFRIGLEEREAIRSHMWPLTLFVIPCSVIGWLIAVSDKYCALRETLCMRH